MKPAGATTMQERKGKLNYMDDKCITQPCRFLHSLSGKRVAARKAHPSSAVHSSELSSIRRRLTFAQLSAENSPWKEDPSPRMSFASLAADVRYSVSKSTIGPPPNQRSAFDSKRKLWVGIRAPEPPNLTESSLRNAPSARWIVMSEGLMSIRERRKSGGLVGMTPPAGGGRGNE